ncbi:hypothetical protein ACFYNL_05935 [Streptomyces sp. NPDC007808]|uniref:hypothetical protein n=1 Tax=Streptomyces sp. NPDC007808 TaxID=3364779 RepID=UPI0036AD5F65
MPGLQELIRDHVAPALTASGVIPPSERPEFPDPRDDTSLAPPGAGHALVVPGRMRGPSADEVKRSSTSDVHVHIERVEVVRPAPEAPGRRHDAEGFDLDGYLDRRRKEYG